MAMTTTSFSSSTWVSLRFHPHHFYRKPFSFSASAFIRWPQFPPLTTSAGIQQIHIASSSSSLAVAQFTAGELDSDSDTRSHIQGYYEDETSQPPESSKLYVGNLPWSCDSDLVSQHFQAAGTVELVELIYDRETGRSRGFGFVTMSSMEEAKDAVAQFDGQEFMGRRLRVNFPDRSRNEGPRMPLSNANRLFVGNLPWGMDDLTLQNLFSEHGKVLEARIVYDRVSGRSRGFGFVTLSSADEVNEAINKLDGAEVQGRTLRVNLASDRPPPKQSIL